MSTTDPYLLEEDQRHARILRPHTLHDHEQHHVPGNERASPSGSNRLNDFASHILESHDPHDPHHHHGDAHGDEHEHEHEHSHGHILSFTGEGGVLESQVGVGTFDSEVETAMRQAMDDGEFQPHIEDEREVSRQQRKRDMEHERHILDREEEQGQSGAREQVSKVGRPRRYNARGGKRKIADTDDNGDPIDPILLKKDAHKEVERKRRTNINEGIDLLVATLNIPDLEKQGKGVQLRRAVEHVQELDERIMNYEKEVHELRKEKQDLEANLALTSQRYTEENERCTRYETLWRDAQDREAKSQFDIAQLLDELAQTRRRMGEGQSQNH